MRNMTEPQCQHCGKLLSEALREGCNESPCKEYKETILKRDNNSKSRSDDFLKGEYFASGC